jgi:hypothetical protein
MEVGNIVTLIALKQSSTFALIMFLPTLVCLILWGWQ